MPKKPNPTNQSTKDLGKLGEKLAVRHLKKNNYRILKRNFKSKFGEIDIIALHPKRYFFYPKSLQKLVFIEVKTRWTDKYGSPERAITPWKIKRIIKTGLFFKSIYSSLPEAMRLDAVVIDMNDKGKLKRIKIIQNLTQ